MSEQKKPEAGEFWEWAGIRLRIVGIRGDGRVVGENRVGGLELSCYAQKMTHLPYCTGFDWQPETFPQFYINGTDDWPLTSYVKRTSYSEYEMYNPDGTFHRPEMWQEAEQHFVASGKWKQVTQAEAESCVKKPEPVESPDDWVTQDRAPARAGIDDRRFVYPSWNYVGEWRSVGHYSAGMMHDEIVDGDRIEIRCRRKDLPPLPETLPKTYVRLWINQQSGRVSITDASSTTELVGCDELKHDGTGFYLEGGK